jgi:energy-coupling factor transport system substrate-specific component
MKRSILIMTLLLIFGIYSFIIPMVFPGTIFDLTVSANGILLNILIYLGLFIIGIYFKFEESGISSKEISLISVYSAFVAVARIPFIGIPSVQPVSYLTFCAGYAFGPLIGFIIGGNAAFVSNIFLGQGVWTIYQIFSWGFIGIIGGLLNRKIDKIPNKLTLAVIGFALAFAYGWFMNIWSWLLIRPISWASFILVNTQSIPFDLAHAIGNFIFLYYFGEKTIKILQRYHRRFQFKIEVLSPKSINL